MTIDIAGWKGFTAEDFAECWCTRSNSHKEMDADLATAAAERANQILAEKSIPLYDVAGNQVGISLVWAKEVKP